MKDINKYVIIVAGGTGSRMNSSIPKQYLKIGSQPVLMHTIKKFYDAFSDIKIILVLHPNEFGRWNKLVEEYDFTIAHELTAGGKTRFQSVKNGLKLVETDGIVAVHDGVRPFVDINVVKDTFEKAYTYGNAIASVPLKDSIRVVFENGNSNAKDRNNYRLIQTPQTFKISLLKKAYLEEESPLFTDDASVLENINEKIHLVEGNYENIKITTPEDLKFAEALLK